MSDEVMMPSAMTCKYCGQYSHTLEQSRICQDKDYLDVIDKWSKANQELTKLRAALDDAIDTVIFYSNSDEFSESHAQLDWGLVNNPVAMQDKGKTAREFLSKHKELIKGEV
jgi:hypothetical protein